MAHVPYRGAGPALTDIVAGHVDMMFDTIVTSLPLHRAGSAKIIAIANAERSSARRRCRHSPSRMPDLIHHPVRLRGAARHSPLRLPRK
jgi:tripartite-type tricarboxylate transporter receptor subunit TctC